MLRENFFIEIYFEMDKDYTHILTFLNQKLEVKNFIYQTDKCEIISQKTMITERIELYEVKIELNNNESFTLEISNNSWPHIFSEVERDSQLLENLLSIIGSSLVYATRSNNLDRFLQSRNDICYNWKDHKLRIPKYVEFIKSDSNRIYGDRKIIKKESLPGHSHFMWAPEWLSFGCEWDMYFSNIYYKYIPKKLFDQFDECFINQILPNGIRNIRLTEHVNGIYDDEFRRRQWSFRRRLGIDSIGHEIAVAIYEAPLDMPVEITKKNCTHGQTKVVQYCDENKKLTDKNYACLRIIEEFLEDGVTIVYESVEEIVPKSKRKPKKKHQWLKPMRAL